MKIIVKVSGYSDVEGKELNALINQFEFVLSGDSQKFAELVSNVINMIKEDNKPKTDIKAPVYDKITEGAITKVEEPAK